MSKQLTIPEQLEEIRLKIDTLSKDLTKLAGLCKESVVTEFVKNKWYMLKRNYDVIVCYTGNGEGFGWTNDGRWSVGITIDTPVLWRPVSDEIVISALIKEAKGRGFDKGVYAPSAISFNTPNRIAGFDGCKLIKWKDGVCFDVYQAHNSCTFSIMYNGVWSTPKKGDVTWKKWKISEITETSFKLDCTVIEKSFLYTLIELLRKGSTNLKQTFIRLGSTANVELEDLEKLRDIINSK